jgi:hypothetical protein
MACLLQPISRRYTPTRIDEYELAEPFSPRLSPNDDYQLMEAVTTPKSWVENIVDRLYQSAGQIIENRMFLIPGTYYMFVYEY